MVNHKLLHPQEVEVYIILPAIRRELSIRMKNKGVEQKEIARRLCVTAAAVSQYLSDKRGQADFEFPESMSAEFDSAADSISDEASMRTKIQHLLRLVLDSNVTCQVHRKVSAEVPQDCLVCFENQPSPNVRVNA